MALRLCKAMQPMLGLVVTLAVLSCCTSPADARPNLRVGHAGTRRFPGIISDEIQEDSLKVTPFSRFGSRKLLAKECPASTCDNCMVCESMKDGPDGTKHVTVGILASCTTDTVSWLCCRGAFTDSKTGPVESNDLDVTNANCRSVESFPSKSACANVSGLQQCENINKMVYEVPADSTYLVTQVHKGGMKGSSVCGSGPSDGLCCGGAGGGCDGVSNTPGGTVSGVCTVRIALDSCPNTPRSPPPPYVDSPPPPYVDSPPPPYVDSPPPPYVDSPPPPYVNSPPPSYVDSPPPPYRCSTCISLRAPPPLVKLPPPVQWTSALVPTMKQNPPPLVKNPPPLVNKNPPPSGYRTSPPPTHTGCLLGICA